MPRKNIEERRKYDREFKRKQRQDPEKKPHLDQVRRARFAKAKDRINAVRRRRYAEVHPPKPAPEPIKATAKKPTKITKPKPTATRQPSPATTPPPPEVRAARALDFSAIFACLKATA